MTKINIMKISKIRVTKQKNNLKWIKIQIKQQDLNLKKERIIAIKVHYNILIYKKHIKISI